MSDWINFVKDFAQENNLSYSEALKIAAPYYRRMTKDQSMGWNSGSGSDDINSRKRYSYNAREQDDDLNRKMYKAGVLIGGVLAVKDKPLGALAALLSGLDANISIK